MKEPQKTNEITRGKGGEKKMEERKRGKKKREKKQSKKLKTN